MTSSFGGIYRGKRVLVTGHTGFKGAWLVEWLLSLGAEVIGLSLEPPTQPALFNQLDLAARLNHNHHIGDIRDLATVRTIIASAQADFVFHLAAQPIVRYSYREPVETFGTNVMGTVHVLDSIRVAARPCTVVAITTDKSYENREWLHAYREDDPMGGHDPYSASKGAAELAITSYRRSFFSASDSSIRLASARAGNVIGGGDWAADRIVPDSIRALRRNEPISVRNKVATRPWQHVLEPLSGYLWLGAALAGQRNARFPFSRDAYACAFNFGPALSSNRTVEQLVGEILKHWPGRWEDRSDPNAAHEASLLNLSIDKAHHMLAWSPAWEFSETVSHTIAWYHAEYSNSESRDLRKLTLSQIDDYTSAAQKRGIAWANS